MKPLAVLSVTLAISFSISTAQEWQVQPSGSTTTINGLEFLDGTTGVGVGSGTVFRTSDGGMHWSTQTKPGILTSVWFSDDEDGTAVGWGGNSGIILRTTDKGITWNVLVQPGGNLNAVHFVDSLTGLAVGLKIIVRSTDGGITWQTQLSGTAPPLGDVYMIDQNTAVAVGGTLLPAVLRSSDGGTTWQTIPTPAAHYLGGVAFLDANTGVAVGVGGTIIRTTDAGLTWSLQASNTTLALTAVRFNPSGTEAIAVGEGGTIIRSSDAGISWESDSSPTSEILNCVSPTEDTGWTVAGGNGTILHSSSMTSSSVSVDIEIDSLHMIVPAEGDTFAYTMTFTNLSSSSQVVDVWTKVLRPLGNPIDPLYGPVTLTLDPFEVVVIDTAKMGVPFDARSGEYSLIAFVGAYQSDTLATDTTRFVKLPEVPCGDISQFQARCRPGGNIQARVILTTNSHTGDRVEFTVDDVAHEATVGQNRRALLSLTGYSTGAHIVELTEPPGCFEPITVTCPAGLEKEYDEWVYDLVEEDTDEATTVQNTIPARIALLGNYPNPFNPTTVIKYELSSDMHVSLKLYDVLGKEVMTLVDEPQTAGYYQVILDGSRLANGVYFYRFSAGKFVETRKILLVK